MANRAKGTGTIIHDRKRSRWIFQYWQVMADGKKNRRALSAKTSAALEQRIAKLDITVAPDITLRGLCPKGNAKEAAGDADSADVSVDAHGLTRSWPAEWQTAVNKHCP